MSSTGESKEEEFKSHSEIVDRFIAMRDGVESVWNKINELRNEVSEHQQVIRALEPMEPTRRCFRLVGDVLVEKTVGEVVPIVKQNEQGLQSVLTQLTAQLEKEREALASFQKEYKIRVKGESTEGEGRNSTRGEISQPSQGVLVSTS